MMITALNADVDTVSNLVFLFSPLAISAAVTVGCLVYLLVLSPALFPVARFAILAGITIQVFARRYGLARFTSAREVEDELQKLYPRRYRRRQGACVSIARGGLGCLPARAKLSRRIRDLRLAAVRVYCSANAFGTALFFAVIGLVLILQKAAGECRSVCAKRLRPRSALHEKPCPAARRGVAGDRSRPGGVQSYRGSVGSVCKPGTVPGD